MSIALDVPVDVELPDSIVESAPYNRKVYYKSLASALRQYVHKGIDEPVKRRIRRLRIAFKFYMISIQLYHHNLKSWHMDPWQWKDIDIIFKEKKVCINRARGGSKTRDMATLAIFFTIIGYTVLWFTASLDQKKRAQKHWYENPYVIPFNYTSKLIEYVKIINGHALEVKVLTPENSHGPRANVIFYDEMAQMKGDHVTDTNGIINGMGTDIYFIHLSTPVINSIFHQRCQQFKTLTHDCYECSWFVRSEIEIAEKIMPKWKFKQEFLCMFCAAEGMIFEANLHREALPETESLQLLTIYGSDPNPEEGYCCVGIRYTNPIPYYINSLLYFRYDVIVMFAHNFGGQHEGKTALLNFLLEQEKRWCVRTEFETNGAGLAVYHDYLAEGGKFPGSCWTDSNKSERVNYIQSCHIYFDLDNPNRTPKEKEELEELWNQVNALRWAPGSNGKKIDKPKSQKWHLADSFLHAMQPIDAQSSIGAL